MLERVQRALNQIPGYTAYQSKERRRDDDRAVRNQLADELDASAAQVETIGRDLANKRKLDLIQPVESLFHQIGHLANRVRIAPPYVLSVGTRQPRKNYGRLAQAHRNLIADGHDFDLVIAGKPGWLVDEVDRELERAGLGDHLRILDYVPSADLCPLYSGAEIFMMPSLYEGFGLPLLEAMASGTPTIAAKRSSLIEIAGNAAVLVDPLDVEALSRALVSMARSEDMRLALTAEGRAKASQFSWETAGLKTAELFASLLHTV